MPMTRRRRDGSGIISAPACRAPSRGRRRLRRRRGRSRLRFPRRRRARSRRGVSCCARCAIATTVLLIVGAVVGWVTHAADHHAAAAGDRSRRSGGGVAAARARRHRSRRRDRPARGLVQHHGGEGRAARASISNCASSCAPRNCAPPTASSRPSAIRCRTTCARRCARSPASCRSSKRITPRTLDSTARASPRARQGQRAAHGPADRRPVVVLADRPHGRCCAQTVDLRAMATAVAHDAIAASGRSDGARRLQALPPCLRRGRRCSTRCSST